MNGSPARYLLWFTAHCTHIARCVLCGCHQHTVHSQVIGTRFSGRNTTMADFISVRVFLLISPHRIASPSVWRPNHVTRGMKANVSPHLEPIQIASNTHTHTKLSNAFVRKTYWTRVRIAKTTRFIFRTRERAPTGELPVRECEAGLFEQRARSSLFTLTALWPLFHRSVLMELFVRKNRVSFTLAQLQWAAFNGNEFTEPRFSQHLARFIDMPCNVRVPDLHCSAITVSGSPNTLGFGRVCVCVTNEMILFLFLGDTLCRVCPNGEKTAFFSEQSYWRRRI